MQFIKAEDYDYIMKKYSDDPRPIPERSRFIRQDKIFNENTGLDGDLIISEIVDLDKRNEHLSHSVRKALALEFVLKNTRISCDPRDIFPAINALDRPLQKALISKWSEEIFGGVLADTRKNDEKIHRLDRDRYRGGCWYYR